MTPEILLQAFALPLAALVAAAFSKQWLLIPIVVVFWIDSLWIRGMSLNAMHSIAMAATLSTLAVYYFDKVNRVKWHIGYFLLATVLSIWQVKNFADQISILAWVLQLAILAFVIFAPTIAHTPDKTDFMSLLWILPAGFVAVLSPIAASIMIGQFGGLVAVFGVGLWLLSWRRQISVQKMAIWVLMPTLFVAQMAWHYAEIDWKALILGLLALIPLLVLRQYRLAFWQQLLLVALVAGVVFGAGLWMEWPEQSLY